MTHSPTTRAARIWARGLALGFLILGPVACDSVLEVTDPDIVTDVNSAAAALGLRNGVVLRFAQAMDGSGDAPDGYFLMGGLLADEWRSGDTFEQRNTTDFRILQTTNSFLSDLFRRANRVRVEGRAAVDALRQWVPTDSASVGQMFALTAFAENQMAEFFCNGIPLSGVSGTQVVFGNPVSYDSVLRRAVNSADSALLTSGNSTTGIRMRRFAAVIKGRALLNRNLHALAATAVATVPDTFRFLSTHSTNSTDNVLWLQSTSLRRLVIGDVEGVNGLNFRSANDPRIPTVAVGNSFDNSLQGIVAPTLWDERTDPVIIASGIEARLIEAEAFLRAGDAVNFLAKLNAARATRTDLPALTDPGTPTAREDLLFRERGFWMFSTGHRQGDLRRLIRQYGRAENTVFPTGVWFKGGPYGSDVNFPVPFAETNNPSFTACTDRVA